MKTIPKISIIIAIVLGLVISIPILIAFTSSDAYYTQEIDPRILEATNGFAISSNMDIYKISLIEEGQSLFFTVSENTDGFIYMDNPLGILQKIYPKNNIVSYKVLISGTEIPFTLDEGKITFGVNNARIVEIRGFSEHETKPPPWVFRTISVYVIIPKGSANPNNQFHLIPEEITVVLGQNNTVIWINEDDTPTTLTSDLPGWSTGLIKPNETASITFNHTGVFNYHGDPHPWKTGKIIVLEE